MLDEEKKRQMLAKLTQRFEKYGDLELAAQSTLAETVGQKILEQFPDISSELFQFALTMVSVGLEDAVKKAKDEDEAQRLAGFSAQTLMAALRRHTGK